MDNFYKDHVMQLFATPFYNINFNESLYKWNNFKNIFKELFNEILNTNKKEEFIQFYYIFILLYIYYTNFLKYNSSDDYNNNEIYLMINSLNNNKNILFKLIKYSDDSAVRKIIKYCNKFIYHKICSIYKKYNTLSDSKINSFVQKIISNSDTINKFISLDNNNSKKILSVIIYRHISSLELGLSSYHDFFIKKTIKSGHSLKSKQNNYKSEYLEHFLNQIPINKQILDLKTNNFVNREIIPATSIIEFLLNDYDDFYISSKKFNTVTVIEEIINNNTDNKAKNIEKKRDIVETVITISHKNSDSKIIIKLNSLFCEKYFVEFNIFQSNISLIHFNNKYINNINFIKESDFLIQIDVIAQNFNDPSDILDFIHYMCISFKIVDNYPSDISEFISPLYFNSYYYDSFYYFIKFFKNNIHSDSFVGKFIIEFVKFLYIYSYYDYYIYYKTDLLELILSNYDKKNMIFNEFYENFKNTLKLGPGIFPYPPFCDTDDDPNRIIYYTFDIPSYFKLYDFYNAFIDVFEFKSATGKENITIYMILLFINELKTKSNKNIKSKKISHSQNSYDEIFINKSNFVFDTDVCPNH